MQHRPPATTRPIGAAAVAFDVLAIGLAGCLTLLLAPTALPSGITGPVVAAAMVALWTGAVFVLDGYDETVVASPADERRRVLLATVATAALGVLGAYLAGVTLSRTFVVPVLLGGAALMLLGRTVLRRLVSAAREHGALVRRVLLVGDEAHVDEFAEVLDRHSDLGYVVTGALTPRADRERTAGGIRVLGNAAEAADIAALSGTDLLLFAGGSVSSSAELRRVTWELQDSRTRIVVAPSVTDIAPERITMRPLGGVPLLHLDKPRAVAASKRAKRAFDIATSATLLFLTAPLFVYAAFRIWRFDGGPIFFRHERIGRYGDAFGCWKFRTMVVNADEKLAELLAEQGVDGAIFAKLKDDPRVTGPGRWLRRLSLDELPQLLNVLTGTMSLVGPRPQTAVEVAEYDEVMARRLHVKPGMTGLWQVSGRSDLSVPDAIRLDSYYVENWSMTRDLGILFRTPVAVMTGRGAY